MGWEGTVNPLTLHEYMVEPARGVTRSSGIAVSRVLLLRLRTDDGERVYVISPTDARELAAQLILAAEAS